MVLLRVWLERLIALFTFAGGVIDIAANNRRQC
jgi:hypothetical protein